MRLLDLFCGRWGWSRAFAARGWECVGIDLEQPPEVPIGCNFYQMDVMDLSQDDGCFEIDAYPVSALFRPDFIVASPPCEEFSIHGMKHFHPNPKYPEIGIELFNYTRQLCEASGLPYVIENVRAAQQFVGNSVHHCGPFNLWGTGVPPLLNQGIKKNLNMDRDPITGKRTLHLGRRSAHGSKARTRDKAITATIPPELANCVAAYAERLLEQSPARRENQGAERE